MHYMIENYFATKMYDELNNLETVINGNGIVEGCDIEHLSGFLVYDEANEVVKIVDFDPTKFETWNGREVVIDEEKKKEFESYEENRAENLIIPIAQNDLGDDFVNDNGLIWINGTLKKLLIYKGNLTESELEAENAKTIEIKEHWENPNHKISSAITCDPNGIVYSNEEQTLPFTTLNNNGLQVFEETDDYIIYIDKDAVVTTVEQYVPGTYDLFLEERRAIENDVNRFRTWTSKDDSELLLKINDEQLKRIAETPVNMDEPSEIQTFTARAIPTTYECCFRVDKASGEIYIGEGYENLGFGLKIVKGLLFKEEGDKIYLNSTFQDISGGWIDVGSFNTVFEVGEKGCLQHSFEFETSKEIKSLIDIRNYYTPTGGSGGYISNASIKSNSNKWRESPEGMICSWNIESLSFDVVRRITYQSHSLQPNIKIFQSGDKYINEEELRKYWVRGIKSQTTRTQTPKPFVRGVMPESKLALPTIEDLGEIVSKDGEVIQHENGTVIVDTPVYDDNMPDNRISMGIHVGANGEIVYKNNPNDPMPIKTRNMAGLQKWEETDDYIIYLDKDAIVTTVQNYVPGTFDLFNERKSQIEAHAEMLKMYDVEWTPEDSEKLLLDVNNAQLERIASTPTTMDEPTEIQTFSARAVPTTYECCFRTDKKSGEIYIGEGYENLFSIVRQGADIGKISINGNSSYFEAECSAEPLIDAKIFFKSYTNNNVGDVFSFASLVKNISLDAPLLIRAFEGNWVDVYGKDVSLKEEFQLSKTLECKGSVYGVAVAFPKNPLLGQKFSCSNSIVTKTSTPKPFVKSVMPSGKLSFVTNATSETHSFVMNGITITDGSAGQCYLLGSNNISGDNLLDTCYIYSSSERPNLVLISKEFNNSKSVYKNGFNGKAVSIPRHSNLDERKKSHSFKQLLIYKGNLTEAELKAENEKEIKLDHYTFQDNSIVNKYFLKGFSSLMVYQPKLTSGEITEELRKTIKVDKLDFNPKSIKRYLSNLESFSGIKTYSQNLTESEILEEVSKDLVPLFRNTGAIPNSSGEVKEIEARVKVPAIGGAFDDDKKAGIYSSWWTDINETNEKVGTRIAWKK